MRTKKTYIQTAHDIAEKIGDEPMRHQDVKDKYHVCSKTAKLVRQIKGWGRMSPTGRPKKKSKQNKEATSESKSLLSSSWV